MKRLLLLLLFVMPAAIPLHGGCNAQSEGQLCSPLDNDTTDNGNSDCQAGLLCLPLSNGAGTDGVCCLPNSANLACVGLGSTSSGGVTSTGASSGAGGTGGTSGTGGAASSSTASSSGAGGAASSSSSASSSSAASSSSGMADAGDGGG